MSLYRTPLAQILPAAPTGHVIEKAYKARITDAGRRHPVTRDLPGASQKSPNWGSWFRLIQVTPNAGEVLMQGAGDNPLLMLNRLGEGRVAILLSDHAWLWARGFEGGGPHTILLRRLAHWLMQEPDLEEEFLTAKSSGFRLTIERRSMQKDIGDVKIKLPSGVERTLKLEEVSPGLWRKQIDAEEPGLYRFFSGTLSALAHAGALNSREMAKVVSTDKLVEPALKATGGGAFWLGRDVRSKEKSSKDLPRIAMLSKNKKMHGQDWLALRDRNAYRVKGAKLIPLLNGILALAVLIGMLSLTWHREGR